MTVLRGRGHDETLRRLREVLPAFEREHDLQALIGTAHADGDERLHAARRFSKRVKPDTGWDELLRRGIRGSTTREVLSDLARADGRAELLEPGRLGLCDRIDLWHRLSSGHRHARLKAWIKRGLRAIRALTGVTAVPQLSLAIRKRA